MEERAADYIPPRRETRLKPRDLIAAIVATALGVLSAAPVARASDDLETQVWGNFTLGWIRSTKTYLELDIEHQILVVTRPRSWRHDRLRLNDGGT